MGFDYYFVLDDAMLDGEFAYLSWSALYYSFLLYLIHSYSI
jgi:hypothetical protein